MKRVLFISYFFPPTGGAGVQRSVKFVRYLPELGYEPVVLTGPGSTMSRWSPTDATLATEIPPEVEVIRIEAPEPAASRPWRARGERWLRLTTPFAQWWSQNVEGLGSRTRKIDLIYASMSPFETTVPAARLAQRLGVPWVADLRDPWALDEMMVYPTALHRKLELARMQRELSTAAHIIMNTPEAAARLRMLKRFSTSAVSTIPNGYDAIDFAVAAPLREDTAFRIVHSGYLHTQLGREHHRRRRLRRATGGSADVDILTRSVVYLSHAIEKLRREYPGEFDDIELHLVGVTSDADVDATRGRGVVYHGYLPHDRSIEMLRSADLLFLPMQNLPPGERATIVPGKTYEYLAADRPILAAVPDGDAHDLLASSPLAQVCRPDDVAGMADAVRSAIRAKTIRESPAGTNSELVRPYERRQLTADLAAVFDETVIAGRARVDE